MSVVYLPGAVEGVPEGTSESDEWVTPAHIFTPLALEFDFTVDAFAAKENTRCTRYWTKRTDALRQDWRGERVWANPPYSDLPRCVEKMAREADRAQCIVALLPAWTDRAWWHDFIESARRDLQVETRFLRGRLRFGTPTNPTAHGRGGGRFPSVLVIWG